MPAGVFFVPNFALLKDEKVRKYGNRNQTMLRLVPAQANQRKGQAAVRLDAPHGEADLHVPLLAAERGTENVAGGHK